MSLAVALILVSSVLSQCISMRHGIPLSTAEDHNFGKKDGHYSNLDRIKRSPDNSLDDSTATEPFTTPDQAEPVTTEPSSTTEPSTTTKPTTTPKPSTTPKAKRSQKKPPTSTPMPEEEKEEEKQPNPQETTPFPTFPTIPGYPPIYNPYYPPRYMNPYRFRYPNPYPVYQYPRLYYFRY